MTKVYIKTNVIKNNVMENLYNSEVNLANARSYFNSMIIPNDYVNKDYLNWYNNRLKEIQDEIYNVRNGLNKASYTFEWRHDKLNDNINNSNKIQINSRTSSIK